jgi:hypothetical protein
MMISPCFEQGLLMEDLAGMRTSWREYHLRWGVTSRAVQWEGRAGVGK